MNKSETIGKLAASLAKFQGEVENPKNTAANSQYSSKYAPLDVVINTIKPILAKYGLSFIQSTSAAGENITVSTMLLHESGEWLESEPLTVPGYQIKKGGVKEFNAQGAGSAITYLRRYSLTALLGISSEDDDDGNNVSNVNGYERKKYDDNKAQQKREADSKPVSPSQVKFIESLVSQLSKARNVEKDLVVDNVKAQGFKFEEFSQLSSGDASVVIGVLQGWLQKATKSQGNKENTEGQ